MPRRGALRHGYGKPACVVQTPRIICCFILNAVETVTIHVPGQLRAYCGGAEELQTSARRVRVALEALERTHSALYRNVCDETGAVRRHLNVFVNADNVRDLNGVDTKLTPGDVLTILPAVSGG